MKEIKIFENDEFGRIRMFMDSDNNPWFCLKDLCRCLGIVNTKDCKSRLSAKGVGTTYTLTKGGKQLLTYISESNLYRCIMQSRKTEAVKFQDWIVEEVLPSIRKKGFYGTADDNALPEFIRRFKANMHNIPKDYFSVISEMYMRLYGEFEKVGYKIPDVGKNGKVLTPDISVGKCFADFLRENNSALWGKHKTYKHHFPDGRVVDAYMYPIDALPMFIRYINERWMPEKAEKYFRERDPEALEYLPRLLENKKTA